MAMRHITSLAGGLLLLAAAGASAQTAAPVAQPLSTATLANLCASQGGEMEMDRALGFCRGFIISAGQYHREITLPGGRAAIFCLPTPAPSVSEAQASFVAWAGAHPQYAGEAAVNGLLRWAAATYPCPTAAAPTRRTRPR